MIYIKLIKLFFNLLINIKNYDHLLEKPDGLGKSWKLYKRPIFAKKISNKKNKVPETKAHYFIYNAFGALESKDQSKFQEKIFDTIAVATIWYINSETKEENNEQLDSSTNGENANL